MGTSEDETEQQHLLAVLDRSVAATPGQLRRRTTVVCVACAAAAALGAALHQWAGTAIAGVIGAVTAGMGMGAVARASPERVRSVLDALRGTPERITRVRHHKPRYAPVQDWLEISTADTRVTVEVDDWKRLYSALQRRCPRASFVDD